MSKSFQETTTIRLYITKLGYVRHTLPLVQYKSSSICRRSGSSQSETRRKASFLRSNESGLLLSVFPMTPGPTGYLSHNLGP